MKKIVNFIQGIKLPNVLNAVLTVAAVALGGGMMAAADNVEPQIGNEGPDPADADTVADREPVKAGKNDRQSPGGRQDGQSLTGTQASSTQLREGGLVEDEWDTEIVKFYPYKTPLLSIARQVSKKVNVQNWEVKHMRVGGETLDGVTTADIAAGATVELTSSNFSGSLKPFYKGTTAIVPTVAGYKEGSTTETEGHLMLFVIEANSKKVVLQAVNGKPKNEGDSRADLDNMTCPAIPEGSTIVAAASACSESQLIISPENYQPREKSVYVQKKLLNIIFTDDYEKVKKKQPLTVTDLKADAIQKYNLRAERSYWLGAKSRFKVENNDGAIEDVYTSEGLIPQLTNAYAIGDTYSLSDLIAISKLQFTEFSENASAFAFCGKNAIERLENIKAAESHNNDFINHNEFNLTFKRFTNTFGSIDFIWDQTLDLLHMEDFIVIMDLKGARRYVKIAEKERTNDMSNGAGEIREAKRWIHQEADAIALRGYNSILVGPADKISNIGTNVMHAIISAAELPETPTKGMKYALTADYTTGSTTYEAGNVYYYTGTAWELYKGQDIAD